MNPSVRSHLGGDRLRVYLDSADITDWERLLPQGWFHGVTTNPLLLERTGQPCTVEHLRDLAGRAGELGAREIHLQTWGRDAGEMLRRGLRLAEPVDGGAEIAVKVPATAPGFEAAAALRAAGRRVTLTAVYSPGQALAAAALGADYAAPYLGRLDDAGRDGTAVLRRMRDILRSSGSTTRLLVASLRSAEQVVGLAAEGFDTFTFRADLAAPLTGDDLTEAAAADFERAAGS